jgi:hypothetical protein
VRSGGSAGSRDCERSDPRQRTVADAELHPLPPEDRKSKQTAATVDGQLLSSSDREDTAEPCRYCDRSRALKI